MVTSVVSVPFRFAPEFGKGLQAVDLKHHNQYMIPRSNTNLKELFGSPNMISKATRLFSSWRSFLHPHRVRGTPRLSEDSTVQAPV